MSVGPESCQRLAGESSVVVNARGPVAGSQYSRVTGWAEALYPPEKGVQDRSP